MSDKTPMNIFGKPVERLILRDRFIEPPFSVLNTKSGNWQNRKRDWKNLGIESEIGRNNNILKFPDSIAGKKTKQPGLSIFDPALCEVLYHWFCPTGGSILDPFAGGSVRGIVANYLGYNYTGIDIRKEQVISNKEQGKSILEKSNQPTWLVGDSNKVLDKFLCTKNENNTVPEITPVELHDGIFVKREDLYTICGANGAKARAAYYLITTAIKEGYTEFTTAGSRVSPQINIVAKICRYYGVGFVAHAPKGKLSQELLDAQESGATIIQHKAGYNNVIIARAKAWAEEYNAYMVPFGMMCQEAVEQTAKQVQIPKKVKRIVITVGSGMNLCGLLLALQQQKKKIPVLGIVVGKDPTKTLNKFAPKNWESMVTLQNADVDYHTEEKNNVFKGIVLDPIYEAKCIKFLKKGDLFWIIGLRSSMASIQETEGIQDKKQKQFDMLFSCPPYANLEVYSKLKGDISNMDYSGFMEAYRSIIKKSCTALKTGGYAVFVVGEVRGKDGYYLGFVQDTIKAFRDAGMGFYNDAILLDPIGTAMLRAGKYMKNKKLVKVHQNILVFKKI